MKKIICVLILCFIFLDVQSKVFLVFGGKTGWIGQQLIEILQKDGHVAIAGESRLESRDSLLDEINTIKPDCVINAAGITGKPNVDWCETNKQQTIRVNMIGVLNLADITYLHDIHMINMGTGCIYEYDDAHPMYSGIGFTEEEMPNFHGSFYSHSKCMLDDLLMNYPNVLNLRLRMPISSDLSARSFISKITKYEKVINIPNSMSVLSDLLPLIPKMAERKLTGNYNFVNPGVISHNEILDCYKEYVDASFTYKNFTVEEQDKILKARRSNNELDVSRLLKEFPAIPIIKDSIKEVMKKITLEVRDVA